MELDEKCSQFLYCASIYKHVVYYLFTCYLWREMTLQTSTSDTINILSQSHSIIYGETMDPNSQTTVSLDTIHSLLIDINTKLTAIEGNNAALESRLSQIKSDVS